eukprot:CAMPEP_0179050420 /NCGR_PEP_ID=MMETSP0796-20121207/20716_1 /TAXON_ID=73915 /ORGANISM="Pyrodinium bahamense, Strain pbaha01" /LENGTH=156 /DNA_ID=CAMNT_0020746921 /DNA_START=83 /DNA_END=553 /DNA_ORIENTATION=+
MALLACALVMLGAWGPAFLQASPGTGVAPSAAGANLRIAAEAPAQERAGSAAAVAVVPAVLVGALALAGAASRGRARTARRAEAISKPAGTSQWVNEQSPGMSHPCGFYVLPYVPEEKAAEYDYTIEDNKKDTTRKQVGCGQPVWDITENFKGKFN